MTTITSATALPGHNVTGSAKSAPSGKALPQDFLALLSQTLAEGGDLSANPLLQLMPQPLTAEGLAQPDLLADDQLSQLLTQTLQSLSASLSQQPDGAKPDPARLDRQRLNNDPLQESPQELAALHTLMAMLPQAPSAPVIASAENIRVPVSQPAALSQAATSAGTLPRLTSPEQSLTPTNSAQPPASVIPATMPLAEHQSGDKNDATPRDRQNTALTSTKGGNGKFPLLQPASPLLTAATQGTEADSTGRSMPSLPATTLPATAAQSISPPAASPAAATVPSHSPLISAPLGSPQWQQSLGQSISLFSRQGRHSAELRLHPAELGSVKISLKLDDNQAQLQMISPHSHVRAALEAALPALRAQFAENGIQLGQSSISNESFAGQQQQHQQQQAASQPLAGAEINLDTSAENSLETPASLLATARGDNAVDTFV